ncbi:MAG: PD-(D/E)XK nuclease family protein [Gammaproteobacteria bacterium]|nr:PD-(D/E)XK nuclease family protein [Gammaproteobacteria bacterium]
MTRGENVGGTGDRGWLDDAIEAGAEIVTANRRLARYLTACYGERQLAAGRASWRTPPVRFWRDWLDDRLLMAADPCALPRRLDSVSSSILWERCMADRMPPAVLGFGGIVRQAVQTWQRLGDWDVPLAAVIASARTDDEKRYARAAADYRALLDEGNWIDHAGLPGIVADLCAADATVVPGRLVLVGFDRLTPAVRRVADALEKAGCAVSSRFVDDHTARAFVGAFADPDAELRAAGAWAAEKLGENPNARIAVVCPGLEADAARVGRMVREGLAPGWQWGGAAHRDVVNLSYGRRLADYPAVASALLTLQWAVRGLRHRELSILVRSPFIGAHQGGDRSRLDLALRRLPDRDWSPGHYLAVSRGLESHQGFAPVARAVEAFAGMARHAQSPARCAEAIDGFLSSVGWPGAVPLDSAGFQLVNRWRELLNEFSRAAGVVSEMHFSEAIGRVTSLAADTVWQPETGNGVVEVMGMLEAAGLEFDYLWVAGLDATQWPAIARPVAFLARSLQAEFDMPDSRPQASLEYARLVTRRLLASAGECVLSWPRSREDAEMSVSPLVEELDVRPYEGPGDPGWAAFRLTGTAPLQRILDDDAPPVTVDEIVRSGAYTIQKQRSEPFSAFAEGRLGISEPEALRSGLSPGLRGNIVHDALYNLLADRPGLEEIRNWKPAERIQRTGVAIDTALAPHQASADEVTSRIIGIERSRVQRMLQAFIEAELERPPFAVERLEERLELERFGVRLRLRVDRIDRLADGRLLIIDYKTGQEKVFATRHGELKDAQLVVYSCAVAGNIGALAIVNVDSRGIGWKAVGGGLKAEEEAGWSGQLRAWQDEVDDAVRRLGAGDARINVRQSAADSRPHAILSRAEAQKRAD